MPTDSAINAARGFLELGAAESAWEMLEDLPPELRTDSRTDPRTDPTLDPIYPRGLFSAWTG
jgi:hypothetical protein